MHKRMKTVKMDLLYPYRPCGSLCFGKFSF